MANEEHSRYPQSGGLWNGGMEENPCHDSWHSRLQALDCEFQRSEAPKADHSFASSQMSKSLQSKPLPA